MHLSKSQHGFPALRALKERDCLHFHWHSSRRKFKCVSPVKYRRIEIAVALNVVGHFHGYSRALEAGPGFVDSAG